jgi:hypothetical protein
MSRKSAELDSFAARDSRARQCEKQAWGKSQARDFHLRGCRCGAAFQAKGTTIARKITRTKSAHGLFDHGNSVRDRGATVGFIQHETQAAR